MRPPTPPAQRYAIAVGLTAAAVAFRWFLDPWLLDGQVAFIALPAATAAAVWFGGYGAGTLTALAGYVACDYFFINSRGFGPYGTFDAIRLAAYLVSSFII